MRFGSKGWTFSVGSDCDLAAPLVVEDILVYDLVYNRSATSSRAIICNSASLSI